MPLGFTSAKVNNGAYDQTAQGRQADFKINRQGVSKCQEILCVLVETVLCDLDSEAEEKSAVTCENANKNSEQREIDMLVQPVFAQST